MGVVPKIKFDFTLPLYKIYHKSPGKSIGNNSFFLADFLTLFLQFFGGVARNLRRNRISEVTVSGLTHGGRETRFLRVFRCLTINKGRNRVSEVTGCRTKYI